MTVPKCFISYSWDSPSHKDWVRSLAENLQKNGVHSYLDQWDVSLGDKLPQFMETSVRESDFVLLVCTAKFAEKANSGKGGVGYETSIVTGEIYSESTSDTKFVALLREGGPNDSLPSFLKSKAYLDFRSDDNFDKNIEALLRHIFKEPKYVRPPLGKKPNFNIGQEHKIDSASSNKKFPHQSKLPLKNWPFNLKHNYSQIEFILESHGAKIIELKDRKIVVELNGHTITYQKPKRVNKPVSRGLLEELERFVKSSQ